MFVRSLPLMKSPDVRINSRLSLQSMSCDERGAFARALLLLAAILAVILIFIPYVIFGKVVPPNFIGVRQNYFGLGILLQDGFVDRGLQPGLHWQIPNVSQVLLIPRDFRIVNFGPDVGEGGELSVPTTDGSKVKTAVALVFRFYERPGKEAAKPEPEAAALDQDAAEETNAQGLVVVPFAGPKDRPHGGPRDLILKYTPDETQILEKFSQVAENQLRKELSELSTADYYNPVLRERAALRAQEGLGELVAQDGIQLWATLIRRYNYAEAKIDDQIFAKNLQDQTERLNAAASKLAEAKAKTERERALWDAKIQNLQVEGESRQSVLESEGRLYEARKKAEGDFLVAKARAEVDAARSAVLSEASGSDVYIARELAPILRTLTGGVVSNMDPFDIDKWVERFLGKGQR